MKITQEDINQYAANGGSLRFFTGKQIQAIPQEIVNQCAVNGWYLGSFTNGQIEAIPQEIINQRAANGGDLSDLTEEQIKAIPEEISKISKEGLDALILFGAGKIKREDLPANVILNYALREKLLNIVKAKLIQHQNQVCKEQGYTNYVPIEIQERFNEELKEIYKEINEKKKDLLEQYDNKKIEERAVNSINNLRW